MNKQQLAQKIWASANQMRSKIEASEYKDFILGFIFYKYLSDKEIEFLKAKDYDDELLKTVSEDDEETVKWVQQIYSRPGLAWARILTFPTSAMRSRHSAD